MTARHDIHRETNREIEIKLRVADLPGPDPTTSPGLGAVEHGRVLEQNTLYDTPDSDFRRRGRLF